MGLVESSLLLEEEEEGEGEGEDSILARLTGDALLKNEKRFVAFPPVVFAAVVPAPRKVEGLIGDSSISFPLPFTPPTFPALEGDEPSPLLSPLELNRGLDREGRGEVSGDSSPSLLPPPDPDPDEDDNEISKEDDKLVFDSAMTSSHS